MDAKTKARIMDATKVRRVLARLATDTGFADVRVIQRSLEQFAREAGVPEEHLPQFGGAGARFLLARR